MLTDLVLGLLLSLAEGVLGLLPAPEPVALPSIEPVWAVVAQVDSLVPVWGPLKAGLALLALVVVFIAVRLVLVVVNLVWP